MPRADQSQAGKIVAFFRTQDLSAAELVLGLCRDAVNERKQKSAKAKAAQQASTAATTAAAPAGAKKAAAPKKKKSHKKKKPTVPTPASEPLPLDALSNDADAGEAGDVSEPPVGSTLTAP